MPRYPSTSNMAYAFGPGPWTPAVRALIVANVVMFVVRQFLPGLAFYLGLTPAAVFERLWLWQPFTYLFLHGGVFHLVFNMLALWMFGTEFERMWRTRYFVWFYFATGLAAAVTTLLTSLLPFAFADLLYQVPTVGASGSIYGLLVAYGLYFPNRPIYVYLIFPIPAKYFVLLIGGITFLASEGSGVAHAAHLGGAIGGYLLLRGARGLPNPLAELKYRYLRWKLGRAKRRFDVHTGGRRDDWDRRIH